MHAVVSTAKGFVDRELVLEPMGPLDVQVRVDAVAINPHDVKAMARLRGDQTAVYGYDVVGHIEAVGISVTEFHVGERVLYSGTDQRRGAFAELHLVDSRLIAHAPVQFTDAELAGLPLAGITSFELLFDQMGFQAQPNANAGQRLLVINGAGGVGSILTQLARWSGLEVIATASPNHFDDLLANGVTQPVDYHYPLAAQVGEMVDGTVVLADLDQYLGDAIALTTPYGKIGVTLTSKKPIMIGALLNKSLSLVTEMIFTKTTAKLAVASQGQLLTKLMALLTADCIHPLKVTTITGGLTAASLNQAATLLCEQHISGKIVICH